MFDLIRKDMIRRWRSPMATLAMIIFPLFMTIVLGGMIGSMNSSGDSFPKVRVLVEDNDTGFLSDTIIGLLGQDEGQEYLDVVLVEAEGRQLMEKGEASALVIFPENFTDDVFAGEPTTIQIVRNPAEGIKPEIIYQGAEVLSTYLDQTARLLGPEFATLKTMLESEAMPAPAQVGLLAGSVMGKVQGLERYVFPPLVGLSSAKEAEEDAGPGFSIMGYVLVMTTVMALLFVASRSIGDLFEEQKSGMLRRQLATPIGIARIVGAKIVFGVVFGVVVITILAVIGLALGWIELPVDPLGALLLGISFSLAACGLLALVFSLVNNEKQAGIMAWLVIMGMSALGGSMVPVESMPAAMRGASVFTLNFWAIDGFKNLLFFQASTLDLLGHVGRLLAAGALMSLVGHVLMVRKFKEVSQ